MAERQYLRISIDQVLEDATQPDNVMRHIPDNYSQYNSMVSELHIPLVESIGNNAFSYSFGLTTLDIPKVKTIGNSAFIGCGNIVSVNAPKVKSIGNNAFQDCSNIIDLAIGESLTSVGYNAFAYCSSIESVNFPNLKRIQENTFASCKQLKTVTLDNASSIESKAFENCTSLTELTFPLAKTIVGNVFNKCTNLKKILMPSLKVISQDSSPFNGCTSLQFLELSGIDEEYPSSNVFTGLKNLKLVNLQGVSAEGVVFDEYKEGKVNETICYDADVVCRDGIFHKGRLWMFGSQYDLGKIKKHPCLKYEDPELVFRITEVVPDTNFNGLLYELYASGISIEVDPPFAGREDIVSVYMPRAAGILSKSKTIGAFAGCINLEECYLHALENLGKISKNAFKDTSLKYLYIGRVEDISAIKTYIDKNSNPWALPDGCMVACPNGILLNTADGTEILNEPV